MSRWNWGQRKTETKANVDMKRSSCRIRFLFLCFILMVGCSASQPKRHASDPDTPSATPSTNPAPGGFRWELTDPHGEGCVSCDELAVVRIDKQTGQRVEGTGKTRHLHHPQTRVPTRFLGYEVVVAGTTYPLNSDGTEPIKLLFAAPAEAAPTVAPKRDGLTVQVIVALCDNVNQGIARVPAALGDGQTPRTNLYWGAMYGLKTWFRKQPHWKQIPVKITSVIDRLEYARFEYAPPEGKKVTVHAWAIDGAKMGYALQLFFDEVRSGRSDLVVFVGHNGLMDTKLPRGSTAKSTTPSMVLACQSNRYFQPLTQDHSGPLLLSTFGNMAPEAYTLDAALRSWAAGENEQAIRTAAAKAYAKYQKCSVRAAGRLFGVKP